MDLQQPTTTHPISDDQELAKVLAGVSKEADNVMQFEETTPAVAQVVPPAPVAQPVAAPVVVPEPIVASPEVSPFPAVADDGGLDSIKKDALVELRPLVDKLSLAPEEKFDTYLLLIRSTDDKALIAPAHAAAKAIPDETRRAQALLDIIKEIDFLSGQTV
jgi:hypothetical protein